MARPRQWRKLVKKLRRKRIRTAKAKERDLRLQKAQEEREKLPDYAVWLSEQTALEIFQREKAERQRIEEHKKWEEAEKEAQAHWKTLQERIAVARAEKLKQEARIREEWEREQKKIKEEKERKIKEKEEKERRQVEFLAQIDAYINGSGPLPEEAAVPTETHPSEPDCPFFSKVGACRFWDFCSRNHKRPGISKVLLFPGFFSHISLDHLNESNKNEYDTDVSLEYNDEEAYAHFKEFYEDVVKELKTFGELEQFKVCCNAEQHLRGNVYAQYASKRAAMKAYRALQGRWYSGKQITVEFTRIPSWKNAICGLFQGARCPKGKNCNFLHVFWNPTSEFKNADKDIYPHRKSRRRSRSPRSESRRHWRWSESPEPVSLSSVSRRHDRENSEERRSSRRRSRKDDEESRRRKARYSERKRRDDETESDFSDSSRENSEHRKSKKRKRESQSSKRNDKDSERRSRTVDETDETNSDRRDSRGSSKQRTEKQNEKSSKRNKDSEQKSRKVEDETDKTESDLSDDDRGNNKHRKSKKRKDKNSEPKSRKVEGDTKVSDDETDRHSMDSETNRKKCRKSDGFVKSGKNKRGKTEVRDDKSSDGPSEEKEE